MGQLTPVTFPSPGFLGLNKEREQALLGPEWATEAQNCVIDGAGRIAARKGWTDETTTPATGSPAFTELHEYIKEDSTTTLIAGSSAALWESSDNGDTWTARIGAVTAVGTNWQFVNFNDKLLALVPGGTLGVKTSGNIALVVAGSGSVPTGITAIWSAFGRVWVLTKTTLYWSALLDETKWALADGGGSQDLGYLWTKGTDEGVAVAAFGSTLVVFGKRHIFLFVDGSGSDRGLDPSTMYVDDTLEGVGCVARGSVQAIGEGDLVFLTQTGVRSLGRTIQEKASPPSDLTGNSRDYFVTLLMSSAVDRTKIRSVYSPEEGLYLLTSPDNSLTLCIDVTQPLQDNTFRVTSWPEFVPNSLAHRVNGDLLFGWSGQVGKYSGYLDGTATYRFVFRSGWLDLGEQNATLKMLKRIKVVAFSPAGLTVTAKWFFDFKRDFGFAQFTYEGDGADEYSVGLYGTAEYSGGISQRITYVPASRSGQYMLLGVETEINGHAFAIQSLTAYYTTGRLA